MPDRVSIRDLAKIAGVSRATVSLALRGSHEVAPQTREKIQALAKEYNYRSHPAVNTLMQQVRAGRRIHDEEIIAFVRSGSNPDETAPGPLEILAGARDEAHRLGYRIELFWAGYCASQSEQLARVLYHRGIRGLIWGPMPYPHPPILFPWQHFVPIACTSSTDVPNLPIVSIHHPKGMALLLEELAGRGARRIGVLLQYMEDQRQDYGWVSGTDLYRHRGGQAHITLLLLREPLVEKQIRAWAKNNRLDALVLSHELYAETHFLNKELARASLDIPSTELGKAAGLYQDMVRLGQHAVRSLSIRLVNGILGLPENPFSVVTQASFKDGDSLRLLAEAAGRKPRLTGRKSLRT